LEECTYRWWINHWAGYSSTWCRSSLSLWPSQWYDDPYD